MADTGFSRPSLADIVARIEADFNTRLPGADSRVRRSVLSVLARVLAAAIWSLYGYLDFLAKQLFPDTATGAFLRRWAAIYKVPAQLATQATGTITVTGSNGTAISTGKILQRGDGLRIETTSSATVTGGTAVLNVKASEAGAAGNSAAGTIFTFISPISGANAQAISGTITGGADDEDDEALRARVLERMRQPAHGGAKFDYEKWAKDIPNVTRAWVYPLENGQDTVTVRFMMDDTYSNGIPLAGDVDTVKSYISNVRPVCAELFVSAPIAVPLNFTIGLKDKNGDYIDDPVIQAAVEAELRDLLRREAEPKADGVINEEPSGTILYSHLRQAISNSAGEYDHEMPVPNGNVTPDATGKIWVMGAITWLS